MTTIAAVYARYSSSMQADGYSIEAQLAACRDLCASRGYTVAYEFVDEAKSAATVNRPQFQRMMSHARARRFDVLVCHKLDRLSRSLADIVTTLDELKDYGVTFVSVGEAFDFTTPTGQIMLAVLGGLAQWYRSNLQQETSKGKQAKVRAGGHNGSTPFGYIRAPDETRKPKPGKSQPTKLIPSDDAPHVVAAFEAYAGGTLTDSEIANLLNSRGAVTKGGWGRRPFSKDTVTAMLKNKMYCGYVAYRGLSNETTKDKKRKRNPKSDTVWYKGEHEQIISEQLFTKCQNIRARRAYKYAGTYKREGSKRVYLLQRIAICAKCGRPLRCINWSHAEGYRCTSNERGLPCSCKKRTLPQSSLEDQIALIARGLSLTDDMRDAAMGMIAGDELTQAYNAEKRKLDNELKRVAKIFQIGASTEAQFENDVKRIKAAQAELKPPSSQVDLSRALDTLSDMAKIWGGATQEERAEILRTIFESVSVDIDTRQIVRVLPRNEYAALVGGAAYFNQKRKRRDSLWLSVKP